MNRPFCILFLSILYRHSSLIAHYQNGTVISSGRLPVSHSSCRVENSIVCSIFISNKLGRSPILSILTQCSIHAQTFQLPLTWIGTEYAIELLQNYQRNGEHRIFRRHEFRNTNRWWGSFKCQDTSTPMVDWLALIEFTLSWWQHYNELWDILNSVSETTLTWYIIWTSWNANCYNLSCV